MLFRSIYILHVAAILGLDVLLIRNRASASLGILVVIFVAATTLTISVSLLLGRPQ